MKFFLKNILTLIVAIFLSVFIFVLGMPFSIGLSIHSSFKKDWKKIFFYIYRFFNGILFSLGYLLFSCAKFLDILWCVCAGEAFEYFLTTREDTMFGTFTTISEATGKEEKDGFLIEYGMKFSKTLSSAFGQKNHCLDAYKVGLLKKELEDSHYK